MTFRNSSKNILSFLATMLIVATFISKICKFSYQKELKDAKGIFCDKSIFEVFSQWY